VAFSFLNQDHGSHPGQCRKQEHSNAKRGSKSTDRCTDSDDSHDNEDSRYLEIKIACGQRL